jgi:hypothetical protein
MVLQGLSQMAFTVNYIIVMQPLLKGLGVLIGLWSKWSALSARNGEANQKHPRKFTKPIAYTDV